MPEAVLYVMIGLATGFLAGTLGAGGGFATVTLLLAVGLANQEAVATSLLFTIVVGAWGAALHFRQGTGSMWVALALGIPSAVSAFLAAEATLSHLTFNLTFAAIAGITGLAFVWDDRRMVRREQVPPPIAGAQDPAVAPSVVTHLPSAAPEPKVVVGAILGGAAIGALKGVFGVGGGFLLVPYMVLVLRVPERLAVGSSLLAILLGSAAGGVRHALLGNVEWSVLGWLMPGGVVASLAGTKLVPRMSPRLIRRSFTALLLATATFLAIRAFT